MELIYQINPELDVPIYQQLVDTIRAAVKKGDLVPNQQLPTVQELSEQLQQVLAQKLKKQQQKEQEPERVKQKKPIMANQLLWLRLKTCSDLVKIAKTRRYGRQ